jgi:hypothetical protein
MSNFPNSSIRKQNNILRNLSLFAIFFLLFSVSFIVLERFYLPFAWYPYHAGSLLEATGLKPTVLSSDKKVNIFSRSWFFSRSSSAKLTFRAKVKSLKERDLWGASDPAFQINWVADSEGGYTRVLSPKSFDPYLYRSVTTESPIAGQHFRVSIQMRSRANIPALGCRGVWLQENGGSYASRCVPVALTNNWQTFSFDWIPPRQAISRSVRVVINDFDGFEFDLRNLVIEQELADGWKSLLPLEPTGAALWLDWTNRDKKKLQPNISLNPDGEWHKYSIQAVAQTPTKVSASLWLEPGFNAELKDIRWETVGINSVLPQNLLIQPFRSAIWYGDPNTAGHSLATLCLVAVFLTSSIWFGSVASILGLIGIYFTESRTAWFAILAGLPWLLWFLLAQKQRLWFFGALFILGIVGFSTKGNDILGRLATVDQIEVTRQSIWRVAASYISDHPWGGSSSDFTRRYSQSHPEKTVKVTHAHNFWLQMGVRFGFLGLLISIILTAVLIKFFWLREGWRALALLLPILWMNVFDYSFDNLGVWLPIAFCGLALQWIKSSALGRNNNQISKDVEV